MKYVIGGAVLFVTVGLFVALWVGGKPDVIKKLQVCERQVLLSFDDESKTWQKLDKPERIQVICRVPGATGVNEPEGIDRKYTEKEIPGRFVAVECYQAPRFRTDTLPIQMPDGLYCNIPGKIPE